MTYLMRRGIIFGGDTDSSSSIVRVLNITQIKLRHKMGERITLRLMKLNPITKHPFPVSVNIKSILYCKFVLVLDKTVLTSTYPNIHFMVFLRTRNIALSHTHPILMPTLR